MRFSISIPQRDSDGFDDSAFKSYLARAEELGFEGGWTLEQTVGAAPLIAPLELLSYAAACTTRLRLGVAVLITSLHDPLQLASNITAVDRLSHGRLDVGVAPGGGFRKFEAFGVDGATFISSFNEGLALMKAAWSDEPKVTFHGRLMSVRALIEEKRRFVQRWPQRYYAPRLGSIRTTCAPAGHACTVRTVFDFTALNPSRGARSHGTANLELGIRFANGQPMIVLENSRVTRRGRSPRRTALDSGSE